MSNIAVVNVVRLLDESKKGKVLAGTLRAAADKWQKELADLEKQFNDGRKKLEEMGAGSSDAHYKLQREVKMLEMDLRHLQGKAQLDIESRREQARNKVLAEIEPVLNALAKERGIDIVLTVPSKEVAFIGESADLTNDLLAKIDSAC